MAQVLYIKLKGMKQFSPCDADFTPVKTLIHALCFFNGLTDKDKEILQKTVDINKDIEPILQVRDNGKIIFETI